MKELCAGCSQPIEDSEARERQGNYALHLSERCRTSFTAAMRRILRVVAAEPDED